MYVPLCRRQGPGDFPVRVICKGLEFCCRKNRALNGRRACHLCAEHGGVPTKIGGDLPREFANVFVIQHGCNLGCESLGGRIDQDDKRTTGAGAEDRYEHHGSSLSISRSTRLLVAESIQSQARRLCATARHQRKGIRRKSGRAW